MNKPNMKSKRQLQDMLIVAFGHKLMEALEYADEQFDTFEHEPDDACQAEHNVQLVIDALNATNLYDDTPPNGWGTIEC